MDIVRFTENLVKSISPDADLIKVTSHESEDDTVKIDILVPEDAMGAVLGRDGKNIKAIRTLINAYAYKNKISHVEVEAESF